MKTDKILNAAMVTLLKRYSFRKITVRDICYEAQISRATFYARFADKYDFLKSWLTNLVLDELDENNTNEEISKILNNNFYNNRAIIKNLISDVDSETLEILADFILNYFIPADKRSVKRTPAEQVVLSNFFAGGMMFYIMWQVKNRFPPDVTPMNIHLYELIRKFRQWDIDAL